MTGDREKDEVDLAAAMLDPARVFATPEEVVAHPALTRAQKIEILRRWEYDAAELAVAREEGMPGDDESLLHRVLQALDELTGGVDVEHTGPTKQRGLGD
jgi:hypothetical protein